MNKKTKRRLTRCVVAVVALAVLLTAYGVVSSLLRAETASIRTDVNDAYFEGDVDMRSVEVTRAATAAVLRTIGYVALASSVVLLVYVSYNGYYVQKYLKEKKDEES